MLIADRGYGAKDVKAAVQEWLRFIYPEYYLIVELQDRGLDPAAYGLTYESSCYSGNCELPFDEGGCGGMKDLNL